MMRLSRRAFLLGSGVAASALVAACGVQSGSTTFSSESAGARKVFGEYLKTIEGFPDAETFALLERVAAAPHATNHMVEVAWNLLGDYRGTGNSLPQPIPPAAPLSFPGDHAQHLDTEREWYYETLSLTLDNGATLSVVATFLRSAIGTKASSASSSPMDRQIFSTSIGITIQNMPGRADAHFAVPTTTFYPGSGGVTIANEPFEFRLGNSSFIGERDVFPLHSHIVAERDAATGLPSITVDVSSEATNALFLQGENGYVGAKNTNHFYYYSWPNQKTSGAVTIDGKRYSARGVAWLDHQWGTGPTPPSGTAPLGWGGWSWFEFQFDADRALTLSIPHGALTDGKLPSAPLEGFGTYIDSGKATLLGAMMTVPLDADVASPTTGALYPTQWDLHTFDGPQLHVVPSVAVEPQTLWFAGLEEYSEATCTVVGTLPDGSQMSGVGYCESVGFEDPIKYKARAVDFLTMALRAGS